MSWIKKKHNSSDLFQILPHEIITHILSLIPTEYFYYTLNIINRYWNQIIADYLDKKLFKKKYDIENTLEYNEIDKGMYLYYKEIVEELNKEKYYEDLRKLKINGYIYY